MKRLAGVSVCFLTICVYLTLGNAQAAPLLPYYAVQTFGSAVPDNPYFPMTSSLTRIYAGEKEEEGEIITERFELTNQGMGPVILGVQTWIQRDRAFEGELLVEDTFDYYAQDTDGNVWYFGEDVTNYIYDDDDNLIETTDESAWRAGVNDALPGIIMLSNLAIPFNYFQEYAVDDEALDHGTIFSVGNDISIGFGMFSDVLQILEGSVLEPDAREFKFYAPNVGLIRVDEGLDELLMNPEITLELVQEVPIPAAALLFPFGLAGGLGWMRRRSR